ncbi:unnamed protein product [Spirodela intermedia]|uniref:Uncharacterized protein n=2 Tax=Spirodela intermedia TaxID=51605 RepID=A0A7I8JQ20_SPIIN|nr:unnamed protein product [Spirodela intermedia]CAA6671532.1 unnamed protein product [Spirodela intermedia]CAA7408635.1 unnamed protein product [Spirodela intermedia]
MLNGTNFKAWKENIMIVLDYMDLDIALRKDHLVISHEDKRDIDKWDRSNHMSTTTKKIFEELEKKFAKNDKVETSTVLAKFISMKYKGKKNIREYILEMSHLASKLKALKLKLSEDLLVHLVFISLPVQFNQFKVNYNCQMDKWSINELISHCVQKEEKLKQDKHESAHLTMTSKNKIKKIFMINEAVGGPPLKK